MKTHNMAVCITVYYPSSLTPGFRSSNGTILLSLNVKIADIIITPCSNEELYQVNFDIHIIIIWDPYMVVWCKTYN